MTYAWMCMAFTILQLHVSFPSDLLSTVPWNLSAIVIARINTLQLPSFPPLFLSPSCSFLFPSPFPFLFSSFSYLPLLFLSFFSWVVWELFSFARSFLISSGALISFICCLLFTFLPALVSSAHFTIVLFTSTLRLPMEILNRMMSVKSPCHDPQDISTSYDNTASDRYPLFTFFLPFQSTQQCSPPKQLKLFFSSWVPETVANGILSRPCIHCPIFPSSLSLNTFIVHIAQFAVCHTECSLKPWFSNLQHTECAMFILMWKVHLISFILSDSVLLSVLILFVSTLPWNWWMF